MRITINLDRLNWAYTRGTMTMEEMAEAYGYSRRRLTGIISKLRQADPAKWPKRNGKPPGR